MRINPTIAGTMVAFGACAFIAGTQRASAYTGQELAGNAKVTSAQAREIALKAVSGKITDEELEKEAGGSGLRYSFDIKRRLEDIRGRG